MQTAARLVAASLVLSLGAPARASLPALPGAQPASGAAAAPAPAVPAAAGQATPDDAAAPGTAVPPAIDRVKRGIVLIEKDGRLLGFGTVLGGDGRILTSLSALGAGDAVDVRYADGALVHAKVGHRDPAWDLALLVPHTFHWKDGLTASEADPSATALRAPVPPRAGAKPFALPVHFKGRTDALSRQGDSLMNALDVEVQHSLPIAGAPLLDPQATVLGVLVHACKLTAAPVTQAQGAPIACAPTLIGAPISAVRAFLARTPADAVPPPPPTPWLGIAGEPEDTGGVRGVRVMAVAPQSPAQKGGLKAAAGDVAGDRIVAVDGQPVDSPQKLSDAIGKHGIGEPVKLLVFGGVGGFREVSVVLRAAPP